MIETLEAVKAWTDVISSVGVIGVMAFFLAMFYRGDILSRKSVETIIKNMSLQIKEYFRDELKDALDDNPKDSKRIF